MKRSQDLIRDFVLDSAEELNRRMQPFCTLLNLLDLWQTFGSGRLCYFKVSEHSDIILMTDDDLLLLRSTKFLSLFVENYQLDMPLHSEWVLFELHV